MKRILRRLTTGITLGLLTLWVGTAIVSAGAAVYISPTPPGDSVQSGYFYAQWAPPCQYFPNQWSRSAVTHVFDGGSLYGMYIYYYDVYGGYTVGPANWFQQTVAEQHAYHQQVVTAPTSYNFTGDWTKWWNQVFHYTLNGQNITVKTTFLGQNDFSSCPSYSIMAFGH